MIVLIMRARLPFYLVPVLTGGLLLASADPAAPAEPDPRTILDSMARAGEALRDYTTILVKQERRGNDLEAEERLLVKWARPQRVYFKSLGGDTAGQEVLFVAGWNRDRIRAHKGSFPDITLNLDPRGSWVMAHTHHPVTETSIVLLVRWIMRDAIEARERGEGTIRLVGRQSILGRPSYEIEMTSPADGAVHIVKKGETLWDIAKEHGRDMFVLLYRNRDKRYKGPSDPRAGDAVFVPRYYAGRVELWVDAETWLPLVVKIYAHDGKLYERYEHHDLRGNVGLSDSDFDPANPAYGF